jgi:voltage-gated potassium channel Kch
MMTSRARIRARFEDKLASGTSTLIAWLGGATILLILVAATVAALAKVQANGTSLTFLEALWDSMLRTLDPGTMGGDEGWPFRIISLFVTLGGVLIVSSLIGLVANGINRKVMQMERGKAPVADSNHTVILGWSPKVFTIVAELREANLNKRQASVVVLAPEQKNVMEEQLRLHLGDTDGLRVICRTGIPYERADLAIANIGDARSVVVLSPEESSNDASVIKTVLALMQQPIDWTNTRCVAEIHDGDAAEILRCETDGRVIPVQSSLVIARVAAQVCRQPGLSSVYLELLDFAGSEIYFHAEAWPSDLTFGAALLAFETSSVIGMRTDVGVIHLNPPMSTPVRCGDTLIVIAEDDCATAMGDSFVPPQSVTFSAMHSATAAKEEILIVGWNPVALEIIKELDEYVGAGSRVSIIVDPEVIPNLEVLLPTLRNLTVVVKMIGFSGRALETEIQANEPDHVMVLCYRRHLSAEASEARTLLTLLRVRRAVSRLGRQTNIVAELLDERDVALARQTHMEEFIVSERLTSLLMAQLSENPQLEEVFADLMDADGSEVYIKPLSRYVGAGAQTDFGSLVAAARSRGEIAIGYRFRAGLRDHAKRIVMNPAKTSALSLHEVDGLVVIAETEFDQEIASEAEDSVAHTGSETEDSRDVRLVAAG